MRVGGGNRESCIRAPGGMADLLRKEWSVDHQRGRGFLTKTKPRQRHGDVEGYPRWLRENVSQRTSQAHRGETKEEGLMCDSPLRIRYFQLTSEYPLDDVHRRDDSPTVTFPAKLERDFQVERSSGHPSNHSTEATVKTLSKENAAEISPSFQKPSSRHKGIFLLGRTRLSLHWVLAH